MVKKQSLEVCITLRLTFIQQAANLRYFLCDRNNIITREMFYRENATRDTSFDHRDIDVYDFSAYIL